MNSYVLKDGNGEVYVSLKIDALNKNHERFTVFEVDGQQDVLVSDHGFFFREEVKTVTELVQFAEDKNLTLEFHDHGAKTVQLIRERDASNSFSISL